ncbi:MAG TPA: Clp protease N-terminal domain-containing protein [Chloroflexota bacterium]|nr:Clp protease N-terminal domain-containing protein [Chloroflexota bacterium]
MSDQPEQLTREAREALRLAQEEAVRANHTYAGSGHVLLGVLGQGSGAGAGVLRRLGVTPDRLRAAAASVVGVGPEPVAFVGFTPRARRLLASAADEARRLGHAEVGPDHLLLAIAGDDRGIAHQALALVGVGDLGDLRRRVLAALGQPPGS